MSRDLAWFFAPAALAAVLGVSVGPVRRAFANGWRCIRRHDSLWKIPVFFALAYAIFQILVELIFRWRLKEGLPPLYTPPPPDLLALGLDRLPTALFPAAEMLMAVLNCLVSTFPISALFGGLFLMNWRGATSELRRALCKRFGNWGWIWFTLLVLCAICALLKPLPMIILPELGRLFALRELLLVSTIVNALSFVFEYLLGTAAQLLLLFTAYGWMRGMRFPRERLLHFAVRRLGFVFKWALVFIVANLVTVHLPLLVEVAHTGAPATLRVDLFVRPVLVLAMLLCATVQIRLALHNDSLRSALAANARFLRSHGLVLAAFLLSAFGLLLTLKAFEIGGLAWLEGTLAGHAWTVFIQTLAAAAGGWILAAWACFYTTVAGASREVRF